MPRTAPFSSLSGSVSILVEPIEKLTTGAYVVSLQVKSDYGEKYDVPLKIYMAKL